jgi:hypothetical protein
MRRFAARVLSGTFLIGLASRAAAEPPVLVPCDELPAAVAALGQSQEVEAFAIAPGASLAIVARPLTGDATRSVLRFARGGDPPREVKLSGHVAGLAVTADGKIAYAIVRVTDRKGGVRSVDLVRCDLEAARATIGASLPVTARGLAVGFSDSILWVASRNELRTFQLPGLLSGPLYRALGDNVGVAPMPDSTVVYVAQPSRVVLADLSAAQDRDGLALAQEVVSPAPLTGMLASAGASGPIALSAGAGSWCVRDGSLPPRPIPPPPPPPAENPPPVEAQAEPAPAAVAPVAVVPAEVAPAPVPENVAAPPVEAIPPVPAAPGTVSGTVTGPAIAEIAAIVLLGPDNVLHEAARVIPDDLGRFGTPALLPGSYRIVAAGKGGRVLICDPPFITVRVSSNSAVEAPVLKIVRVQ